MQNEPNNQEESPLKGNQKYQYVYALLPEHQGGKIVDGVRYVWTEGEVENNLRILGEAIEHLRLECIVKGYSFDIVNIKFSSEKLKDEQVSSYGFSYRFTIQQIIELPEVVKTAWAEDSKKIATP